MRQLIRDAHSELLKGVRRILAADPALSGWNGARHGLPALTVAGAAAERWAAGLFSGQRHSLDLVLRGPARVVAAAHEAIASTLPGAEFDLPGHLVAEIAIIGADIREEAGETICEMSFEALTVED